MAFLTLGGTLYEIQHNGAHQNESLYAGEAARAFDNSYRSGRRAEKRSWSFVVIPKSQTDEAALRAQVGVDVVLAANGDFCGNVAVNVVANITGSDFLPSGTTFVRVVNLNLLEV